MPDSKPQHSLPSSRSLIIATAGHVDHGKTSLVKHITGTNTDTLDEEKARGLTINLGYAYHHFLTEVEGATVNNTLGFVDVPGHTDFINNMLAGVGAVDAAMLVIAADDGIMPQTREHLAILDLLGISQAVVALTKTDKCDAERVSAVAEEIRELLQSTGLNDAPIFPVSNVSAAGIPELTDHLQSLLGTVTDSESMAEEQCFRYLIDRSFTVKGIGTVVTGSVRAGTAHVGDSLLHTSTGEMTKLRGMRQDTTKLERIHQGQRAAININRNYNEVNRGDWLIDERIYHPVTRFDANIRFITEDFSLRSNAQYHLHIGASHHIVTIRSLEDRQQRFFQIKSNTAVVAHFGDRFVIRDPASQHTIGGGKVIDIFVPRRGRSSDARITILDAMDQETFAAIKSLLVTLPGGVDLNQFALCRNNSQSAIELHCQHLQSENVPYVSLKLEKQALPILLHDSYFQPYCQQILDCIAQYHEQHGNQQGISEPALSRAVDFAGSHILFHSLLRNLVERGSIKRTGTLLHIPTHQTTLSQEEQDFLAKIRPILLKAGNIPPRTRELVEVTGIPLKPLDSILRQTTKAGNLIQVAINRHYLPETIMSLAEFTEKLAQENDDDKGFSVIQFRDATGIGRNLCIEILEYFDRVGFTRRDGNSRFLRTEKENIFGK